MPQPAPVYLIDGSAYIYRAYHAITPLSTSGGLPTHAIYGFVNILLRVLREKTPHYLAVAFDARGPNFRHEIYADYKANRPPMPEDLAVQIPYIKRLVEAYRFLTMEMEGVEADDLIASAARRLSEAGHPVVIVSGDKDLLQLVSDKITFWEPMNDTVLDIRAVQEKYKVAPGKLLDLFALIGDKSDNVPGVPGVGPKTAEKLINEFGSLDRLYENLARMKPSKLKENLLAHKQEAILSKRLIRLKEDLEISSVLAEYTMPEPDQGRLRALFTELEFSRLLKSEISSPAVDTAGFQLIRTPVGLQEMMGLLNQGPYLVLDTETSSLDPLQVELAGISVCVDEARAFYIAIGHRDEHGARLPDQLDPTLVLETLRPLLENEDLPKIGHNLKFDYSVLATHDVRLAGPLWDTMIASYLLNPSRHSHKLDDLCQEILDLQTTSFAKVTGGDKRPDSFLYVEPEEAKNYSCEDVYTALRLWNHFRPLLEDQGLWELFVDIEAPLVPVLADMELAGIAVDPHLLQELSSEFSKKLRVLETEIYRLAGEEFNIGSSRQLGEILFDKLKLPHDRKTKTGYSTDIKVLEKLSFHELPRAIIAHRTLSKLQSTYVEKLAALIHPKTGRIHSSFNQTVTATGRLSSSEPNLQNIPVRTEEGQRIRAAFVAGPGCRFVAGDYSQIDLRVLAHYSQDPALLEAFRTGQDIHSRTAAEIFFVSPLLVTPQMRRVAKTINFGIVYGMSSFGLASQLQISRKEAQTFIDRYFTHYAGVRRFMEDIVEQARRDGYVSTLFNRRRSLPDIRSSDRNRREFAERTAINTPIQGTAADIIKLAMIRVVRRLREQHLHARMLLQIHDELVFEVEERKAPDTEAVVKDVMESVIALVVPLVANLATGRNLAEVS